MAARNASPGMVARIGPTRPRATRLNAFPCPAEMPTAAWTSSCARMAAIWWLTMAREGSSLWVWRVPSKKNPADWPTRPADGWRLLRRLAPHYERDRVDVDWKRIMQAIHTSDLLPAAVALGSSAP